MLVGFLVRETGEREKTIDYRFFEAKSTKQGVKGASISSDALGLCDLTGEPSIPYDKDPHFLGGFIYIPQHKVRKKNKSLNRTLWFNLDLYWCGRRELNPYGKTTRPSNVRVCQFRHSRRTLSIIHYRNRFVNPFFKKNKNFFENFFGAFLIPIDIFFALWYTINS